MRRRAVLRAGLGLAGFTSAVLVGGTGGQRASPSSEAGAAYAPLNRVELAGAADCCVAEDGATAFVAVDDGFAAIALPSLEPLAEVRSIEADREHGPLAGVADLALDGDRLLVPGPANPRRDQLAGFALFDVADPADPRQVAFHAVNSSIHNAAVTGGRAYLTDGLFLTVVDVADDEPVELGSWSLAAADPAWGDVPPALRILHDVRVRDDLAFLSQWDAGTFVVDATDPEDVVVVGRAGGRSAEELAAVPDDAVGRAFTEPPGNHHSTALSADGSLLAVGAEAFDAEAKDGEGGPGGLDLYDVGDPSSPSHLATIDPPRAADETRDGTWTTAHDFSFAGDRLLSAWYQGGVRVHDVSDPTAPAELAWWRRPAEAAFWTALPAADGTFVASTTALPGGDLFSGLYRFPNRPGEQADPPALTETASPTPSPTPTPTPPPSPTPTATPTASSSPTRTPGQPGLGPAAALGGLAGLAAWRRWRDREP